MLFKTKTITKIHINQTLKKNVAITTASPHFFMKLFECFFFSLLCLIVHLREHFFFVVVVRVFCRTKRWNQR